MTKKRARELMLPYIDGELEAEHAAELEAYVEGDPLLKAELDQTRTLLRRFDELQPLDLDADMHARFTQFLAEESAMGDAQAPAPIPFDHDGTAHRDSSNRGSFHYHFGPWMAAAAVILVFMGILVFQPEIGSRTDRLGEVAAMPAPQRLKWISRTAPDPDRGRVLLVLMEQDPQATVRMAAAESIASRTVTPMERQRMVAALQREQDPLVQIALLRALADAGLPQTEIAQTLLCRNDVRPEVKQVAQDYWRPLQSWNL